MTTATKKLLIFIIALTTSVSAFTSDHDFDSPRGERKLQKLERMLDLTADQSTAIQQIFATGKQASESDRLKMRQIQQQIKTEMKQSSVDEQKIRKLAKQAADVRVNLLLLKHKSEQEMKAVLTSEQQAQFELLKELRAEKKRGRKRQ